MALAIVTAIASPARGRGKDACGIIFNTRLSGVTEIEIESVDGNPLDKDGNTIITIASPDKPVFIPGKETHPAVNISIADAEAYCAWLSSRDNSHVFRLPTEEEWILGTGHIFHGCPWTIHSERWQLGL